VPLSLAARNSKGIPSPGKRRAFFGERPDTVSIAWPAWRKLRGSNSPGGEQLDASLDEIFAKLSRSAFRRKFHLRSAERDYLNRKGLEAVMAHGERFIEERLAPAPPHNDGKQTPMRNHPIFVAQHATATCCRGCLEKWHAIASGRVLSADEKAYILAVLRRWLVDESDGSRL
jgi:hypothetical protein